MKQIFVFTALFFSTIASLSAAPELSTVNGNKNRPVKEDGIFEYKFQIVESDNNIEGKPGLHIVQRFDLVLVIENPHSKTPVLRDFKLKRTTSSNAPQHRARPQRKNFGMNNVKAFKRNFSHSYLNLEVDTHVFVLHQDAQSIKVEKKGESFSFMPQGEHKTQFKKTVSFKKLDSEVLQSPNKIVWPLNAEKPLKLSAWKKQCGDSLMSMKTKRVPTSEIGQRAFNSKQ